MPLPEIADYIRIQAPAVAGVSIDRSLVAPGPQWPLESCRQWVVHFSGSRREVLGGGRNPAQQGSGFPGPSASARVFDLTATFVSCGFPVWQDEDPAPDTEVTAWSLRFLADVEALGQALAELIIPAGLCGLPEGKLSLGVTDQVGPQGGVARVSWPLSVEVAL
jgi:hypothetical protein